MPAELPHTPTIEKDRHLIPQPLKAEGKLDGKVHVQVDLPPEARKLMSDLHDDRVLIAVGFVAMLVLLGVAVFKYAIDWRRKS